MSDKAILATTQTAPASAVPPANQLEFHLINVGGEEEEADKLYITPDASRNKCRFEISIAASAEEPIGFTGGHIRLYFAELIEPAIEEGLEITPHPGWKSDFVSGRPRYWRLTPERPIDLVPGEGGWSFQIQNLSLSPDKEAGAYFLKIEWRLQADEEPPSSLDLPIFCTPPGEGATHMRAVVFAFEPVEGPNVKQNNVPMTIGFKGKDEIFVNGGNLVFASPLRFSISNPDPDNPVPRKDNTYFQVSFATGTGAQALIPGPSAGQPLLEGVRPVPDGSAPPGASWRVTDVPGGVPSWKLEPGSGHANLLEPGEVVWFKMPDVSTNETPGMSALQISYGNFPGYTPGIVYLRVNKIPAHPTVFEVACSQGGITLDEPEISWDTFAVPNPTIRIYGPRGEVGSEELITAKGKKAPNLAPHVFRGRLLTFDAARSNTERRERFLGYVKYVGPFGVTNTIGATGGRYQISWSNGYDLYNIALYANRLNVRMEAYEYYYDVWEKPTVRLIDQGQVDFPLTLKNLSNNDLPNNKTIVEAEIPDGSRTCHAFYRFRRQIDNLRYEVEILGKPDGSPVDDQNVLFGGDCGLRVSSRIFRPSLIGASLSITLPDEEL